MVLHAGLEVATVAVVEVLEEHVLLAGRSFPDVTVVREGYLAAVVLAP